jgi:hypothetical protein
MEHLAQCFVADQAWEIPPKDAHAIRFWQRASRTVWLMASLREQNLLWQAWAVNPAVR